VVAAVEAVGIAVLFAFVALGSVVSSSVIENREVE
jgi:hypothetical protein